MADRKDCAHYADCEYRNDVRCPYYCLRYKHRDEVRVVRCKDCKHCVPDKEEPEMCKCVESAEYDSEIGYWMGFVSYHTPDFFCAYGERRSDGKS